MGRFTAQLAPDKRFVETNLLIAVLHSELGQHEHRTCLCASGALCLSTSGETAVIVNDPLSSPNVHFLNYPSDPELWPTEERHLD